MSFISETCICYLCKNLNAQKKFVFKLFVQTSSDLAAEFSKQGNTVLHLSGLPEVTSMQKNHMSHFVICQSFSVFSIT